MILSAISLILATIATVLTTAVGVVVWFGKRRDGLRRIFLAVSVFIGLWIAGNVIFVLAKDLQFVMALLSYSFAMGVAVHLLLFCLRFVHGTKLTFARQVAVALVGYVVGILSAIPGVVAYGAHDGVIATNTPMLIGYGVVLGSYLLAAPTVLILARRRGVRRIQKQQISVVLLGMVISSVTGMFFNLVLPLFNEYRFVQLGPASAVFFVAMVGYAMVRHRLFDVRLAIVRSAAYFLVLLTLIGVYFVLAQLTANLLGVSGSSTRQLAVNIMLTLVIALIFQPVKRLFDRLTKRVFYRDSYDVDDFITEFNQTLGSTIHLRTLLERVAEILKDTFKAEFVFLSVIPQQGSRLINAGTKPGSRFSAQDAAFLEEFFNVTRQDALVASLTEEPQLRRLLVSYNIELLIPLWQNHKTRGYICLGDHLTSSYSQRDLRTLETIADSLAIAVQNALSVQAVKDLNASLEQRIDAATRELRVSNAQLQRLDEAKDEFVSMASHQLRTPLTSIKGYISMLIEGDAGELTSQQKHLLREAFISSERMVRLIGDFLNVSRLQTGKFVIEKTAVNLADMVDQELDSLGPNASARDIKFVFKRPKKFPILQLDENKIRQVIMNFADNAIFYSKDKSKIYVTLTAKKNHVEFTVKDSGIGVPANEQSQLFKKFFRASNARKQRPDGTGVGIFLAKKVVSDHGGQVIFESVEGKGSTFGFKLPLD